MNQKNAILVIVGIGSDEKHHAARFDPANEAVVRKAAGLMGFRLGRAETDEVIALAKSLPEGKIFATGKALVPYIKEDLGRKLISLLTFMPTNGTQAVSDKAVAVTHDPWSDIKVGSVVLCREEGTTDPSWWESVVTAIAKDGETMTVRWRDYPKEKSFIAKRHAVAVIRQSPKP